MEDKLTRNQKLVQTFDKYLDTNDLESIKEELPSLLKSFLKLEARGEKIINQSDNQQLEMLKLKENIEEKSERILTLLNNAGQGFLNFDKDMKIGNEYSKEVYRIFDKDVGGLDISTLLYCDDEADALFFKTTLQSILNSNEIKQEILISLLKDEFFINDAYIQVEYKIINEENFMLVLTDITSKKKLAQQIKDEQQVLKMVVETVVSLEQFISVKSDYESFISKIDSFKSLDRLSDLRKEIHTYKGLFAQKEMLAVVKELHEFETFIDSSLKNMILDEHIVAMSQDTMNSWLESDIMVLKEILGDDFFNHSDSIQVDKNRLSSLYIAVEEYIKSRDLELLVGLGKNIKKLEYSDIRVFLRPYVKLVEQLANRLEKDINPLVLNSEEIFIPNAYKPFINSLVHIFRNSVDHGIETIEKRIELNKDYEGTVTCDVYLEENDLIIKIGDNGTGLDENNIKSAAIVQDIYTKEQMEDFSSEEILSIIFEDTFSMSQNITDVSGRGVGLAAIKQELNALNGTIKVNNDTGKGLEFIFTIPFKVV